MEKVKIDSNAFVYPMPMTIVGAVVDGRPNFLAAAWVTRVNFKPPMIMVALGDHHTSHGIDANGEFSINVPGVGLMEKTDYCGIVSGRRADKSKLFDVFYGSLPGAPLIRECPLSMACRVQQTVALATNTLYIGDIVEAFSDERFLTDGRPDIAKMDPFVLTMPDNGYWRVGERIGAAWSAGKKLKKGAAE